MPRSPYSADGLACARAARLGLTPAPEATGRVIRITRAVFEAGRPKPPRRPRLIVLPAGPTPGDAA